MFSFDAWIPRATPISLIERVRSAVGALLGILATGLICKAALGSGSALPILMAPMGASAVLLFAVPASPLAQPWSILGGNVIAAVVGVSAASLIANPVLAASVAVAAAIALMTAFRCIHPPSGAVALTAVLGGSAIRDLGYGFVLWPVAANSLALFAAALVFNNLVGRTYPHRPAGTPVDRRTTDDPPAARVGFTSADLDAALAAYDQLLDVDRGDLEAILRDTEIRSYRRRAGSATCDTIMSRDVVAITPDAPIMDALATLRSHRIKVLPVTDADARVLGIVTQTDLLDKVAWGRGGPSLPSGRRFRLTFTRRRVPAGIVADIMTTPVTTVMPNTVLADVVRIMAPAGLHHLPVVDRDAKLVGIVSQSDIIVALLAESVDAP